MSPVMIYAFEYHLPERFPPTLITKGCSKTEVRALACETRQVNASVPIRVLTWKHIPISGGQNKKGTSASPSVT
jgi:hypothetical protein